MKIINFLFHGASVTAQGGDSSYFFQLQQLCEKEKNISLRKNGYGGYLLNDTGFATINFDTNAPTDVCFIEWNTTGEVQYNYDKVKYIAGILIRKKILPVFLILARVDSISPNSSRKSEKQILDFCLSNNLICLDYRSFINPEKDLRDAVHTNINGAIKYANLLFIDLLKIINKLENLSLPNFEFFDYSISEMRNLQIDIPQGNSCILEFSNIKERADVIIDIIKGPSSAIIDINDGQRKICIWDYWSHYERPSSLSVSNQFCNQVDGNGTVKILVLHDQVDYSNCAREFSYTGVKDFKIRSIFGVNCNILRVLVK